MSSPRTVIIGGKVSDGLGNPTLRADVCIEGGRIAAVDTDGIRPHPGDEIIDGAGLTVTPGFIDAHSHADNAPFLSWDDTSKILQGVTTEVVGNCGMTLAPRSAAFGGVLDAYCQRFFPPIRPGWNSMAEYFARVDEAGSVTNVAPLVGHGTVRVAAMGMEARAPSAAELNIMKSLVEEAVDAGAFGISSGLIYPPGVYSDTDELIELVGVTAPDSVYASHIRGEAQQLLDSVHEALRIGREAGRAVQISHLKAAGSRHWGTVRAALAALDEARAGGQKVGQDAYPYRAASSMLTAALPPWFQAGGEPAILDRLRDRQQLERLRVDVRDGLPGWENEIEGTGYDGLLIASTASHCFEGKTVAEVASDLQMDPLDALVHVLLEEELQATMIMFSMSESDVEDVLADASTAIGSDGLPPGTGGKPHPRLFGTFPRVLGRYVTERKKLTWDDAIRKMTSLPAGTFGLRDRGRIVPGAVADVVLIDAGEVTDDCDFQDPVRRPRGIVHVMQEGRTVVRKGRYQGVRHGRRLRQGDE